MKKTILIAPNAFKGSLSSVEALNAIQAGLAAIKDKIKTIQAPIADGGDGTLDLLRFYFKRSKFITCYVHDPLMRKIKSKWLLLNKDIAVIELAQASGLKLLLKENELNPLKATTYGTGELIKYALNKKVSNIIIALGGSATCDAGVGLLAALGVRFLDKNFNLLEPCGKSLSKINFIDLSSIDKRILKCKIDVLCDVKIPLTGKYGTINLFSAQKGASKLEKIKLEQGMKNLAKVVSKVIKKDYSKNPMTGSAGGVGFLLKALLGAKLYPGFLYLAKLTNLERKIKKSRVIISGEGYLDSQTLLGKGVIELAKLALKSKKKLVIFCGGYNQKVKWEKFGISYIFKIKPSYMSLTKALKNGRLNLQKMVNNKCNILVKC